MENELLAIHAVVRAYPEVVHRTVNIEWNLNALTPIAVGYKDY